MNQQNEINELMNIPGLSGPDMTSSFKGIGNGDMQTGIKNFAEHFHNTGAQFGKKIGFRNGVVTGSVITLIASSVVFAGITLKNRYDRFKQEQALREQEAYFIRAINKKASAEIHSEKEEE